MNLSGCSCFRPSGMALVTQDFPEEALDVWIWEFCDDD